MNSTLEQSQSAFNVEEALQLRRKLSQVTQQRELLQTALQRLSRTMELCRERLTGLDRPSEVPKILESLRPLELGHQELVQACSTTRQEEGGGAGSYEFLRHSLEATQQECEEMSAKMLRQSQVNDDLEQSVASAKASLRRLEDTLHGKEDELRKLQHQEAFEKERLEDFQRRCKVEADGKEKEARRLHDQALSELTDRHQQSMQLLKTKLQKLQRGLLPAKLQLRSISEALEKPAIQAMQKELQNELGRMEGKILANLASFLRIQGAKRSASESTAKQLEMQLARESEKQRQEKLRTAQQQAMVAADAADFQARSTREVERLSLQLRAINNAVAAERSLAIQEQSQKERQAEAAAAQQNDVNAALDKARQDLQSLQVAEATAKAELQRQQESLRLLRKQTRETCDSISMVTNGNEHLKEQLAEYKARALRVQQEEEASIKTAHADELLRRQHAHEANVMALKTQRTKLEEEIQMKNSEVVSQKEQFETAKRVRKSLEEEISGFKKQCAEMGESRKALEETAMKEEELWAQERLTLKSSLEEVRLQVEQLEETNQAAARQAQIRAAELAKQQKLQDEHIESLKADLHKAKAQLNEAKKLLVAENDALRDASTALKGHTLTGMEAPTRNGASQDKEALNRFLEAKGMQGLDGQSPIRTWRMGSPLTYEPYQDSTAPRLGQAVTDAAIRREAQQQQDLAHKALARGRAQLDAVLAETEHWKRLVDKKEPAPLPEQRLLGNIPFAGNRRDDHRRRTSTGVRPPAEGRSSPPRSRRGGNLDDRKPMPARAKRETKRETRREAALKTAKAKARPKNLASKGRNVDRDISVKGMEEDSQQKVKQQAIVAQEAFAQAQRQKVEAQSAQAQRVQPDEKQATEKGGDAEEGDSSSSSTSYYSYSEGEEDSNETSTSSDESDESESEQKENK
eukprot:symbB.v1.2.016187.t1/scaffold1227.1/size245474/14